MTDTVNENEPYIPEFDKLMKCLSKHVDSEGRINFSGVRINPKWLMLMFDADYFSVKEIAQIKNAEEKRIVIARLVGVDKFLRDGGGTVILGAKVKGDYQDGKVWELDFEDGQTPARFLEVKNQTLNLDYLKFVRETLKRSDAIKTRKVTATGTMGHQGDVLFVRADGQDTEFTKTETYVDTSMLSKSENKKLENYALSMGLTEDGFDRYFLDINTDDLRGSDSVMDNVGWTFGCKPGEYKPSIEA